MLFVNAEVSGVVVRAGGGGGVGHVGRLKSDYVKVRYGIRIGQLGNCEWRW